MYDALSLINYYCKCIFVTQSVQDDVLLDTNVFFTISLNAWSFSFSSGFKGVPFC